MKKISIKNLYLLLVICIGLICLGVGSTYAVFTTSAEISSPITLVSNLTYESDIIETVNVTVEGGTTVSTTLNVTNSSDTTLNYAIWYMDDGLDVEVVTESGASQGTIESGGSTSVVVSVRNYTNESSSVNLGISSSNDSLVLGSDMKKAQDVNFLMSVSEDETVSNTTNFLSSGLTREQIASITFVDNNTVPSGYTSADVSKYGDGSILMWYGTANDSGYYDVYIGSSSGTTYIDSGDRLFRDLSNCTSINLNDLVDVSKTINMYSLFALNTSLVTLDVSSWNVSNVNNMRGMFQICTSLESLDLSNWDVSNVTDMFGMFMSTSTYGNMELTTIGDVGNWDTSNVTDIHAMFQRCVKLKSIDVDNWDVSNVTDMSYMFNSCDALEFIDVSNWDTSKVTSMASMFQGCDLLETLNVSNWNTGNVTTMNRIFNNCVSLKDINVSGWNTTNVLDMGYMFQHCTSMVTLDISGFNTSNVTNMYQMFNYCTGLTAIYVSDSWSTKSVTNSTNMFNNCTSLVGGSSTTYNANYVDATYAKIDEGTSSPGYFTSKASAV